MSKVTPLVGQRLKGETSKSIQACNDYLRMGPGRSLAKLNRKYREDVQNESPSKAVGTLTNWSGRYGWVKRAEQYDAMIEEEKTQIALDMMRSGLALDYERVDKLKSLFDLLFGELMEEGEDGLLHNLWLPDVKSIGSGEFAERVDIERYNSPIIGDLRGLLDDLAKETGGRVKMQEVKHAGEIKGYVSFSPDEWDADED